MSLTSLNREEKLEKIGEYVNILNKLGYYANFPKTVYQFFIYAFKRGRERTGDCRIK